MKLTKVYPSTLGPSTLVAKNFFLNFSEVHEGASLKLILVKAMGHEI